jgi:predicted nuclease of predicted toxin-antitoxin system
MVLDDESILQKAFTDNRILITNDKDFGEMIFRKGNPHKGVILLRLGDDRVANKLKVLKLLLEQYADQLSGNFVVATETTVRIARNRNG